MSLERKLDALARKAAPSVVFACGALILAGMHLAAGRIRQEALAAQRRAGTLAERSAGVEAALAEETSQLKRRRRSLAVFQAGLPKLAEAKRQLYEDGLKLQEEKRLLEKQAEIAFTYLLVDEAARQVRVMRGEQALESYPIGEKSPRVLGGAKAPAELSSVVSKERFAHPERPKSEQVAGQLQWEPPQVGDSARVAALGEHVVFARGSLILHGPPSRQAEHEAYPHSCLDLTAPAARKLYAAAFVGAKILVKGAAVAAAQKPKGRP